MTIQTACKHSNLFTYLLFKRPDKHNWKFWWNCAFEKLFSENRQFFMTFWRKKKELTHRHRHVLEKEKILQAYSQHARELPKIRLKKILRSHFSRFFSPRFPINKASFLVILTSAWSRFNSLDFCSRTLETFSVWLIDWLWTGKL